MSVLPAPPIKELFKPLLYFKNLFYRKFCRGGYLLRRAKPHLYKIFSCFHSFVVRTFSDSSGPSFFTSLSSPNFTTFFPAFQESFLAGFLFPFAHLVIPQHILCPPFLVVLAHLDFGLDSAGNGV